MSYFGSWPSYKISKFRGAGELAWKLLRISWRIDRILVPLVLPPLLIVGYFSESLPFTFKELKNPYIEAYKKKKEEGKYKGSYVGIIPDKYA
jgi:hypothetical protein